MKNQAERGKTELTGLRSVSSWLRRYRDYITGGASIPMSDKAAMSERRTTAAVARRKCFLCFIGFGEDMVLVVEVIEHLRQLERIFRRVCGFSGDDALAHHGGKLSGTEPELPEILFLQKVPIDVAVRECLLARVQPS